MGTLNFNERPILVFWESTRACLLACKHCRAEAIETAAEGELSTAEGMQFIESLTSFGRPYPVLIFTGGDALMRPDIFELVARARALEIPVGMSPSVTPRLTDDNIERMAKLGVKVVSISLDGASAATHEGVRGIPGHFAQTVLAIQRLVSAGFEVQVNTTVMQENVSELPAVVQLLKETGVRIWEVFFLIQVGRGKGSVEIAPQEFEDVAHFLFEASTYGLTVRTVEAPFFRRVVAERKSLATDLRANRSSVASQYHLGPLYETLSEDLKRRLGPSMSVPKAQTSSTRDGKGIIFVAHNGTVYPAGFLPLPLGNVRDRVLVDVYRDSPMLRDMRNGSFAGKCGVCDYRDLCGGSRSRAFANTNDPMGEDPACVYDPLVVV